MALSSNENYYQLLGVTETATFEDIRQAYHDVCRRFHPDKQAAGGKLTSDQLEFWSALQTAWKCLSNEARRMIYDIRREGKALSLEDRARIQKLQRDQAARDISNMQIQYQQSIDREKQKNGIIVLKALFGDLRPAAVALSNGAALNKENASEQTVEGDESPSAKQAESDSRALEQEFGVVGPLLDVTIPIQCCVDNHRVILATGIGKSDLPGFYNPTIFHEMVAAAVPASPSSMKSGIPCTLYVLYKFKGVTHEINVSETEALWLPLRAHAVTREKPISGPAPPLVEPTPEKGSTTPPTPMGMDTSRKIALALAKKSSSFSWFSPMIILGLAGVCGLFFLRMRARK